MERDTRVAAGTRADAEGSVDENEAIVRVARLLAPVTVLGPGARLGLWVQGCGLACPGCSAQDTWDPTGGVPVPVPQLVDRIVDAIVADSLDGLTITGGEPTDQGAPLASVVSGVRERIGSLDVLVFTGRTLGAARATAPALIKAATCVVAGPYRREEPLPGHRLRATANQEMWIESDASERYASWLADADAPGLQVFAEGGGLYLVGLPRPGDLDRFDALMAQAGVTLKGVSW